MAPTLLILAAGLGSRYGGLKQRDPVGPILGVEACIWTHIAVAEKAIDYQI